MGKHGHGRYGMDMVDGEMSHSFSRNLPMNRNGSGTGWLPDASPMYGYMFHAKKWMYMLHGNLYSCDITNRILPPRVPGAVKNLMRPTG